jgi:hypothetical protein
MREQSLLTHVKYYNIFAIRESSFNLPTPILVHLMGFFFSPFPSVCEVEQLWCRDHTQEDLAKFSYMSEMSDYEKFPDSCLLNLVTSWNL